MAEEVSKQTPRRRRSPSKQKTEGAASKAAPSASPEAPAVAPKESRKSRIEKMPNGIVIEYR